MAYNVSFRDEVVRKVLSSDRTDTILSISQQINVPTRTIRRWVVKYQNNVPLSAFLSDARKIKAVLETINLPIEDRAMFCRLNGVLLEDLNDWELDLRNNVTGGIVSNFDYKKLKAEKQELEKLLAEKEQELAKKDKALAESAALLDLQKKVQILLEKEGLKLPEN
jgi:transposase